MCTEINGYFDERFSDLMKNKKSVSPCEKRGLCKAKTVESDSVQVIILITTIKGCHL